MFDWLFFWVYARFLPNLICKYSCFFWGFTGNDMEYGATLVKHPSEACEKRFLSGWPVGPNENKLASNKVYGVKLRQTISQINNSLLCVTIVYLFVLFLIKIFHSLTWKPAAWVSHKGPLKGHRVTGYRNLSQYVLGNSKSFSLFAGNG